MLKASNVKERAEKLLQQRHRPPRNFIKKLEGLDQDITRAMLAAEKRLGHQPFAHHWSPEVIQSFLHMRFWQLMVLKLQTSRDMSQQLDNIRRQI